MEAVTAPSPWPPGFDRIPDKPWTRVPVDPFATGYDLLAHHTWYANLDPTVEAVEPWLEEGAIVVDYSGGTGILADRLLAVRPDAQAGLLNVDASAKFLRLAAEKARGDPRMAVRLLPFADGRVRTFGEAVPTLVGRVDGLVCANAIHLYPDPAATARSWAEALRPGGRLHVQSGNLGHDAGAAWIIDATVAAVDAAARRRVAAGDGLARHRATLADPGRMAAYLRVRQRYFPPTRPLAATVDAVRSAGFDVAAVRHRDVAVETDEWAAFLAVYHDGVLPWVGGCKEVDGRPPDAEAVAQRRWLIADGLREAVGGPRFRAAWSYVDAVRR